MYRFIESSSDGRSACPANLPADVSALLDGTRVPVAEQARVESAPNGPPATGGDLSQVLSDLNRWEIEVHKYEEKTEAQAGFLGFFSVEAETLEAGMVQEAKRFRVTETEEGHKAELGVSVRLWIAATKYGLAMDLTVPNLAASAQLGQSQARIGLSVVGFVGALGDMLPSPKSLNVENFTEYTDAFQKIQSHVFGPAGAKDLSPTLLGYRE